jgi:xylulokinase
MPNAEAVLAIDLGTSSVKVVVVDQNARILSRGSAAYPTSHPMPTWAEQNPEEWWRAVVKATRIAIDQCSVRIVGIGLTGQMHGTVMLDRDGASLRNAIIWSDSRSAASVESITKSIGKDRLPAIIGSPLATGFQAATVHWLRQHQPDLVDRTATVLLPKDYLRWLLTRTFATDPSDASGTGLLDIQQRQWSDEMLAAVKISPQMLPSVQPSHEPAGKLHPDAATKLGLPSGIPITAGAGDAPAAALAAGIGPPDTMMLTISTGAQVILPSSTFTIDPSARSQTWISATIPAPDTAPWYRMGATLTCGLALRWLRDNLYRNAETTSLDALTVEASNVPPGARGLLFVPYLDGERTPHMDPAARGMLIGLTSRHEQSDVTRAVMEGAIMATLDAYDVIAPASSPPRRLVLAGGGAQNELWRRITADIFGIEVLPLTGADTSALGAAYLALAMTGLATATDIAHRLPSYGHLVTPDANAHEIYQRLIPVFRRAYRAHRQDFPILASIDR